MLIPRKREYLCTGAKTRTIPTCVVNFLSFSGKMCQILITISAIS